MNEIQYQMSKVIEHFSDNPEYRKISYAVGIMGLNMLFELQKLIEQYDDEEYIVDEI